MYHELFFDKFFQRVSTFLSLFQVESVKPAVSQKPQLSPKPRLGETIEMTLPADIPTSGLQTWPLKNRVISTETVKKTASEVRPTTESHYNTLPGGKTSSYVDEVAMEEKRLINALKNGVLVGEEPHVPTVVPSKAKEPERDTATTKWGLRNTRRPEQQVPHPELTSSQRQHLRQTASNPVRPFLTRGSVAERVLIFERCPSDLLLDKRVRAPVPQVIKPQVSYLCSNAVPLCNVPITHSTKNR